VLGVFINYCLPDGDTHRYSGTQIYTTPEINSILCTSEDRAILQSLRQKYHSTSMTV